MEQYTQSLIEQARAAHMAAQFPTYAQVPKVKIQRRAIQKHNNVEVARKELVDAIPAETRHRFVYGPLLMKAICFTLLDMVERLLARSSVKDCKSMSRDYMRIRTKWYQDLHAADMPAGSESHIYRIMRRWMDDSISSLATLLHYNYTNAVMKGSVYHANESDLAGWILAVRDIAEVVISFDDKSLKVVCKNTTCNVSRNPYDAAYGIRNYCDGLIQSMFGCDMRKQTDSAEARNGRAAIANKLQSFDIVGYLTEDNAQEDMRNSNRECPSDRCADCENFPCKFYKATQRLYKNEKI